MPSSPTSSAPAGSIAGAPQVGYASSAAPAGRGHDRRNITLAIVLCAQLMIVLDMTVVNIALPSMAIGLHLSATSLSWVLNAYALTFGGLLLLGGRAGDILGRKRVFIAGIILFSLASLLGGFATSQAWLLGARALQGVGGAIVAPTALSLITTNFPEGQERNRAMGVYAAMSIGGAAVGLLAGGLLTTYASWRWVLFVNVPIGIMTALIAPRALSESQRHTGRFDIPGAITGTLGLGALVYGLSEAAASGTSSSNWGDPKVLASLCAAAVLLATFVLIEARSPHALMPLRIFDNRDRTAANIVLLCVGTAMFGMFFFLTIFVEHVWGYSALKAGIAYLPMVGVIMAMAGLSTQLVPRIGARPLLIIASVISVGGMAWLSRINEHSTFANGMLWPEVVLGAGLGPLFVLLFLVGLTKVRENDAGVASSMVNVGQQVGGSIGLAVVGTVAWSAVASSVRSQTTGAIRAGLHVSGARAAALHTQIYDHALATGFSRGYLVSAGVLALIVIIALTMIRISRQDLSGADPTPEPTSEPASDTTSPSMP